jgi:hypothetical protein
LNLKTKNPGAGPDIKAKIAELGGNNQQRDDA